MRCWDLSRLGRAARHLPIALAIACTAAPALGQSTVQLGRESGGEYSVTVMSWWEIPFRSVVRQRYDFSCGSAALATMLTYHYGREVPEQLAFRKMWEIGDRERIRKVGFSMFEMKEFLESLGYRAAGFRLTTDQLARLRRPTVVLLDLNGYKHFVVVKGVEAGRFLVGDPARGLSTYSAEDFGRVWNGIALAVLDSPTTPSPRFNLASDWGPWSQAPLEDGHEGIRVAIGDLTTYLPPDYQISPQILLDVRIGTVR